MSKLIKNWEELAQGPANDKYKIIVGDCCGRIIPITDVQMYCVPNDFACHCEKGSELYENYCDHHVYLSTHTFYGSQYKHSTKVLQEHGFDIEIDNWDKEVIDLDDTTK